MYRDKDRKRATDRVRQQRRRDKQRDAKGVTGTGVTVHVVGNDQPKPVIVIGKLGPRSCKGCTLITNEPGGLTCPKGQAPTLVVPVFEQAINPELNCTEVA